MFDYKMHLTKEVLGFKEERDTWWLSCLNYMK